MGDVVGVTVLGLSVGTAVGVRVVGDVVDVTMVGLSVSEAVGFRGGG